MILAADPAPNPRIAIGPGGRIGGRVAKTSKYVLVRSLKWKDMLWMFPGLSKRRSLDPAKGCWAFLETSRTLM